MLANWLRAGLTSGRVTTVYPNNRQQLSDEHPGWQTIAVATGTCTEPTCVCAELCPTNAITVSAHGSRAVDPGACIGCGHCVTGCPEGVFTWTRAIDMAIQKRDTPRTDTRIPDPGDLMGSESDWNQLDTDTLNRFRNVFGRSLHVRHIDVGSCNACESEALALSNPYYNFHRLGIFFAASPRQADVLLVTGALTQAMLPVLRNTYDAMPRPRLVIAAGACAVHGGLFTDSETFAGPVNSVIPVDAYIPGCPPTPYALIHGLLLAVARREEGAARG